MMTESTEILNQQEFLRAFDNPVPAGLPEWLRLREEGINAARREHLASLLGRLQSPQGSAPRDAQGDGEIRLLNKALQIANDMLDRSDRTIAKLESEVAKLRGLLGGGADLADLLPAGLQAQYCLTCGRPREAAING